MSPKSPSEDPGESVFVIALLAAKPLPGNAHRYDELASGRMYVESDPIGLDGGSPSTYAYAADNPVLASDPSGLSAVTGTWLSSPSFNLTHAQLTGFHSITPHLTWWGYLKLARIEGNVDGYINIDVRCTDGCSEWDIHNRIAVSAAGSFEWGPNLIASAIGLRAGWVGALGANVVVGGADLLYAEHKFLNAARNKAGPLISAALSAGPTAMCLASQH
jgi:hypothetical protein